jgi:hypothetical protein
LSESYTFGTDEFISAVSKAQQKLKNEYGGNQYPIELNTNDFLVFITILRDLALYGEATRSTRIAVAEILGTGTDEIEPIEEWSADMLGAIAESLGVDGI